MDHLNQLPVRCSRGTKEKKRKRTVPVGYSCLTRRAFRVYSGNSAVCFLQTRGTAPSPEYTDTIKVDVWHSSCFSISLLLIISASNHPPQSTGFHHWQTGEMRITFCRWNEPKGGKWEKGIGRQWTVKSTWMDFLFGEKSVHTDQHINIQSSLTVVLSLLCVFVMTEHYIRLQSDFITISCDSKSTKPDHLKYLGIMSANIVCLNVDNESAAHFWLLYASSNSYSVFACTCILL